MAECEPKPYKCSDGNGGHVTDWAKIKEYLIGGVLLLIASAALTTAANRYFNVKHLEEGIANIQKYQRESKNMNLMQNDRLNLNTKLLYGNMFPKYPCPPDLYWPEEK